jgi:ribonuclease D
MNKWQKT